MKKTLFRLSMGIPILLLLIFCSSCNKEDDIKRIQLSKPVDRQTAIVGTWKQTDLQLGVTADLGGTTVPAGYSVYKLAPALGPAGQAILATQDNTYTFNADGSFSFEGMMLNELLFPVTGTSGKWELIVHNRAVLKLTSKDDEEDPHWINDMTSKTFSLQAWVEIPGVGTAPLDIIMEKQE